MPKFLIGIGVFLIIIGIIWLIFPSAFSWMGRLPGDIRYESSNTRIYLPIVTMIIISVMVSILLNMFRR